MPWSDSGHHIYSEKPPLDTSVSDTSGDGAPELPRCSEYDLRDVPSPVNLLRANALLRRLGTGEQVAFLTKNTAQCVLEFELLATHTGHSIVKKTQDHQGFWFLFHRH